MSIDKAFSQKVEVDIQGTTQDAQALASSLKAAVNQATVDGICIHGKNNQQQFLLLARKTKEQLEAFYYDFDGRPMLPAMKGALVSLGISEENTYDIPRLERIGSLFGAFAENQDEVHGVNEKLLHAKNKIAQKIQEIDNSRKLTKEEHPHASVSKMGIFGTTAMANKTKPLLDNEKNITPTRKK